MDVSKLNFNGLELDVKDTTKATKTEFDSEVAERKSIDNSLATEIADKFDTLQTAIDNLPTGQAETGVVARHTTQIAELDEKADELIADYDSSSTYALNDVVSYSGKRYKCTTAITTAEIWTAEHWTEIATTVAQDVTDLDEKITSLDLEVSEKADQSEVTQLSLNKGEQSAIANVFDATATYTWDDKVTYQGKAYKCKVQSHSGEWNADDFTEIVVYDELSNYAKNDGSYTKMSVGTADNLTSRGDATEETIMSRVAGGDNVIEEGNATIKMLKGNSIVLNQVVDLNKSIVERDVTYVIDGNKVNVTFPKDISIQNICWNSEIVSLKSHNYLIYFNILENSAIPTLCFPDRYGSKEVIKNSSGVTSFIYNGNNSSTITLSFSHYVSLSEDSTFSFENAQIIDLTQMFGSGNEPASVEEFAKRLGYDSIDQLPYIARNSGELISMKASGVKTCGRNLWDEQWELGAFNAEGEKTDSPSYIRSKNFCKVIGGTKLYATAPQWGRLLFYDSSYNFISRTEDLGTADVPNNASFFKITIENATTYSNDICVNYYDASFNGQYEPYWTSTRTWADTLNKYFADGLRSAGTAYDEITSTKAVKRIGVVDLGTLTWTMDTTSGHERFNANFKGAKVVEPSIVGNVVCSKYLTSTANRTYSHYADKIISLESTNRFNIYDSSYTDATTFKASLSGVYLFYELETPEEYTYDELNLSEKVCPNGMEEAVVADDVNSTPIVANMVYGIDSYGTIKSNKSNIATLTTANTSLASALTSMGVGTFTYTNGTWTFTPSNSTASE